MFGSILLSSKGRLNTLHLFKVICYSRNLYDNVDLIVAKSKSEAEEKVNQKYQESDMYFAYSAYQIDKVDGYLISVSST